MNILDAFESSTYIAAKSLMLEKSIGSIEEGKNADIIIWNINRMEKLPYMVTAHPIQCVYKKGRPAFTA